MPGLSPSIAIFEPTPTTVAQYFGPGLPTGNGNVISVGLWDLCLGPDGNIWATGDTAGTIEKFTANGTFQTYPVRTNSGPAGISVGSDHDLWFAEHLVGKIGRITTAGVVTEYDVPKAKGELSRPSWTTLGPDGRTWFVDTRLGTAGSINSSGKIRIYPLPTNSGPMEIVTGPDRNLWISDAGLNAILVLSPTGKLVAEHRLRTAQAGLFGITVGPDKNIWFTEMTAHMIGRMTTKGDVTEIATPSETSAPLNIAAGPDGNVWFTDSGTSFWDLNGQIGYVTVDGSTIREFSNATYPVAHIRDLVFDSNGALWYTEFGLNFASSALDKMIY